MPDVFDWADDVIEAVANGELPGSAPGERGVNPPGYDEPPAYDQDGPPPAYEDD